MCVRGSLLSYWILQLYSKGRRCLDQLKDTGNSPQYGYFMLRVLYQPRKDFYLRRVTTPIHNY